MSKYSSTTNPSVRMFDLDRLKDIFSKQGIDLEKAMVLDNGKVVEVTDEFDQVVIAFIGSYTPGSNGSWDEPPYDPEVEITDVSEISFCGKSFDISDAINKSGWEHMELLIAESYVESYEPPYRRYGRRYEDD